MVDNVKDFTRVLCIKLRMLTYEQVHLFPFRTVHKRGLHYKPENFDRPNFPALMLR